MLKNTYATTRLLALCIVTVLILITNIFIATDISAQDYGSVTSESLVDLHNEKRQEAGLSPLSFNEQLTLSAQNKAIAMLQEDCWDHFCPNGKAPWEFMNEANYLYDYAGENLAEGFFSIDTVMTAWLNSPTHRENILREEYKDIGIGFAQGSFQGKEGNLVIVVHFGSTSTPIVANNDQISIQSPVNGSEVEVGDVFVRGITTTNNPLNLFVDNQLETSFSANEGLFFTTVDLEDEKEYTITVQDSILFTQDEVSFSVLGVSVEQNELILGSVSPSTKTSINVVFLFFLITIFVIDLIMLKFSTLDQSGEIVQNKHHSNYHIGIIIIVLAIITTGGIAGSVDTEALFLNNF